MRRSPTTHDGDGGEFLRTSVFNRLAKLPSSTPLGHQSYCLCPQVVNLSSVATAWGVEMLLVGCPLRSQKFLVFPETPLGVHLLCSYLGHCVSLFLMKLLVASRRLFVRLL